MFDGGVPRCMPPYPLRYTRGFMEGEDDRLPAFYEARTRRDLVGLAQYRPARRVPVPKAHMRTS